jgi:FAD synthetase
MTRILLFGTFDMIHMGHENLFKQARQLDHEAFVIVSIAKDDNVARLKGKVPKHSEQERLAMMKNSRLVDEVVLGAIDDYIGHIKEVSPDIIALGYDQVAYTDGLENKLKEVGVNAKIVRLKGYKPEVFKTSKLIG